MKVVTGAGQEIDLGTVEATPTIGITDYSRRVTDDFGVTTVVERGFARRLSVRLALPTDTVDAVQQRLVQLRATPARWVADDRHDWLDVYGFYKDFELDLAVPPLSFCTLTVEGLAETEPGVDAGGDPAPDGSASSLRLLQPVVVTDAMLAASNVPETDYPQWASGTTYAAGARVIKAALHRVFESAASGNIGNDPAGATGQWIAIGPTNRWAMFDQALGTATTSPGSVSVTLGVGAVDAVALLDVVAGSVRVQAPGYDRTQSVASGAALFLDLPQTNGQITVTVTAIGQASVGTLLAGRLVDLGLTEASPTAGIIDYSRKETDDFGAVTVVPRAWAKRMAAQALIRTDAIDVVANRIAAVRARPSLWIGDESLNSLTVYGFFKDFSITVGENVSRLSLTIEGLSKAAPLLPLIPETLGDLDPAAAAHLATVAVGATKNEPYRQATDPTTTPGRTVVDGEYWADTTTSPVVLKLRIGGSWQVVANHVTNTAQIADGAGLGTTATWPGVSGIPASQLFGRNLLDLAAWKAGTYAGGANGAFAALAGTIENKAGPMGRVAPVLTIAAPAATSYFDVFEQSVGALKGFDPKKTYRLRLWIRWSVAEIVLSGPTHPVLSLAGVEDANPYFANGFAGTGVPAGNTNTWVMLVGVLHGSDYAGADTGVAGFYNTKGEKIADATEFKSKPTGTTNGFRHRWYGTAPAVLMAGEPLIEEMGPGVPSIEQLFATIGAVLGADGNLRSEDGVALVDNEVRNSRQIIDASGFMPRSGSPARSVANDVIAIVSGGLSGIGAGAGTSVANNFVSIGANGALSGGGGGQVTYAGVGGKALGLRDTIGWGETTYLLNRPANLAALAGTEGINNGQVSIGANGALTGGGGGQVTLAGVGFGGDTDAQRNSRITIASGAISGIGTGAGTTVANGLVTIGANGALSGGGGGQVTAPGLGVEAGATNTATERTINPNSAYSRFLGNAPVGYSIGRFGRNGGTAPIFNSAFATRGSTVLELLAYTIVDGTWKECTAGENLLFYYRFQTSLARAGGEIANWYNGLQFATNLDGSGTIIDVNTHEDAAVAVGDVQSGLMTVPVPAGMRAVRTIIALDIFSSGLAAKGEVDYQEVFRNEPGSDVTALAQIEVTPPPDAVFVADQAGNFPVGFFPKYSTLPSITKGGVSIRTLATTTFSVTPSAALVGLVSIDNGAGSATKGLVTYNGGATGYYDLVVTVEGVARPAQRVKVTKENAQPAASGSGGTTGGGGSGGTTGGAGNKSSDIDLNSESRSSTTLVQAGATARVTVATGESIRCTANFTYETGGGNGSQNLSASAVGKFRYSPANANSYTDLAASVTGSASVFHADEYYTELGYLALSQSVAPAAGDYDVILVLAVNQSSRTVSSSGLENSSAAIRVGA